MILVHHFLKDSAVRDPEKVALICEGQSHTFGQIDRDSDRVACELQRQGFGRGDRAAVFMENSPKLVISVFAILKAGGVFTVINPTTKVTKLAYILNDCAARGLIAQPRLAAVARSAAEQVPSLKTVIWTGPPPEPAAAQPTFEDILSRPHACPNETGLIDNDLCAIIYTSGSTGQPKGVMLTHRNMANTAWAISTYLENTPDDVVISVLPLSFDYGLYQVITGARVGFTVVLERSFAYPPVVLRNMSQYHVTGLPGVPTIFARLLHMADFDASHHPGLRYMTNTAAVLPPAHLRRAAARVQRISWGAARSPRCIAVAVQSGQRPDSRLLIDQDEKASGQRPPL